MLIKSRLLRFRLLVFLFAKFFYHTLVEYAKKILLRENSKSQNLGIAGLYQHELPSKGCFGLLGNPFQEREIMNGQLGKHFSV